MATAPPDLKNFRANSVFRASASCSKILNAKKYFNTVKIFRATLFLRESASCSKILNNRKYIINTVKSGHPLFRASASYSKILNIKCIFNTVKYSRATLFFRASASSSNSECKKYIQYSEYFQGYSGFQESASCSKILNDKICFKTVKIFCANLFFSGQSQVAQKSSMMKNTYSIQ